MALLIFIITIKNHKIKTSHYKLLQFGKLDYRKTKIKCSGCHKPKHRLKTKQKQKQTHIPIPANALAKSKFVTKIAVLTEEIIVNNVMQ